MKFSEYYGPRVKSDADLEPRVKEVRAWVTSMRDGGSGPSNGTVRSHIEKTWADLNKEEQDYVFDRAKEQE